MLTYWIWANSSAIHILYIMQQSNHILQQANSERTLHELPHVDPFDRMQIVYFESRNECIEIEIKYDSNLFYIHVNVCTLFQMFVMSK